MRIGVQYSGKKWKNWIHFEKFVRMIYQEKISSKYEWIVQNMKKIFNLSIYKIAGENRN